MKTFTLAVLLVIAGFGISHAQTEVDTPERQPTEIEDELGVERKPVLSQRNVRVELMTMDFGYSSWLQDNNFNFDQPQRDFELNQGRSFHLDIGLLPTRFNLAKHKLNLLTSLNFDLQFFAFENNLELQPEAIPLSYTTNPDADYRKNKLIATFFKVPLLLNYTMKPEKPLRSFRISAGPYAELLMRARQKTKLRDRATDKLKDDFNINRLQYGLSARIGFSFVELYANYALNDFFNQNEGPDFRSVQFGVRLLSL